MINPTNLNDAALIAATAVAKLLPVKSALTPEQVAAIDPDPDPAAVAVVASFVGPVSANFALVIDRNIQDALTDAGISVTDALRPALDAAADAFGAGVVSNVTLAPVSDALAGSADHRFALNAADGTHAWFTVRVTTHDATPRAERADMRVLYDVEMTLTAEIGRARVPVRNVLELVPGSVIELDRAAGAPADILVNGRLIARGEVVVVDEDYGIRITEIVTAPEVAG